MNKTDNLAALIYLKNKNHKWKNIAILSAILSLLLIFKLIFGSAKLSGESLSGEPYIANIKIEGIILENEYRSEILEKIAKEKNIKGVIVNINSPGGGIVGSEILFNNLQEISKNKPIVVLMGSLAASGGYMAAVASDYIIAHNGTLTGSIGVLMQSTEVTELAKKVGVNFKTYKSSALKGSPSPFEKENPLVNKVIQESIIDSYEFFSGLVKDRRKDKLNEKSLATIFDGRVFTGRQALKLGLVDEIGDKNSAISYIQKKLGEKDLPIKDVLILKRENNVLEHFFGKIPFLNNSSSNSSGQQIMAIMHEELL